jgi:hypothetical protein
MINTSSLNSLFYCSANNIVDQLNLVSVVTFGNGLQLITLLLRVIRPFGLSINLEVFKSEEQKTIDC